MFAIRGVASSSIASAPLLLQGAVVPALGRVRSINVTAAKGPVHKRPISPHVKIYKLPPAAIASVSTRITGLVLSGTFAGMGALAMVGGCDIPSYVHAFKDAAPVLVPFAKMAVAFPVTYHYASAMRHLYWDATAKGLDVDSVNQSSYALFAVSGVLTLGLAFYSI